MRAGKNQDLLHTHANGRQHPRRIGQMVRSKASRCRAAKMEGKRPAEIDGAPALRAMRCIGEAFSWSEAMGVGIHDRETGCKVREAAECGQIQKSRYGSYLRMIKN